jgi:uncharacterized protein (DUF4415 family)
MKRDPDFYPGQNCDESVETDAQTASGIFRSSHLSGDLIPSQDQLRCGENGKSRLPGQRGRQKKPTKVLVTMRFSREVLDHFKASGDGWQTRINEILCDYVKHKQSN